MTYAQSKLNVHVTGRRVVATIIDGILLSIVYSVFVALFGNDNAGHGTSGFDLTRLSTGAGLWWAAVALIYYVALESTLGRTVGKMVTGIRVVKDTTGQPPGVGAALVRTLLRIIDGIGGYLLGFIIVLCSKNRRRLGDMAAETLVVRS
jgi:uncharacterized RDD family membrane protein YckC